MVNKLKREVMVNLIVHNVDEAIANALKAQARRRGTSLEEKHRQILNEALMQPIKKSFAEVLIDIPAVGEDTDFTRVQK
ncbi:MAG: plasmid stability protein [Gammaproteobacteria bacterium]|jgi:plasmid stability protein